jgi:hypothetical protein
MLNFALDFVFVAIGAAAFAVTALILTPAPVCEGRAMIFENFLGAIASPSS